MKKKIEPKKTASSTSSKVNVVKLNKISDLLSAQTKKLDQENYWVNETEYKLSEDHPHRQLILNVLKKLESFAGVLEVGCNIGQNLKRIQEVYPETQMAGVDVNAGAVEKAQLNLPQAVLKVGSATELPFEDKSFDVVLADAVLMYVKDINKALSEMARVGRKVLIVIDWEAKEETLVGHSLAREYGKLLSKFGEIEKIKITKETWPNDKWVKYGQLYACRLV